MAIIPAALADADATGSRDAHTTAPADVDLSRLWDMVRARVAASPAQASVVELFELKSVRAGIAELGVTDAAKLLIARAKVDFIAGLLSKVAGRSLGARLIEPSTPSVTDGAAPAAATPGAAATREDAAARAEAMQQPLVKKAMDLFNARLIAIEDDRD